MTAEIEEIDDNKENDKMTADEDMID